jgi:shikimate dehydrogenase
MACNLSRLRPEQRAFALPEPVMPHCPRACIIGHPVAHSRSPLLHGHWLATLRIGGVYERRDVAPEALGDFVRNLRAHGFVGCNVTIPHKEAVLDLVDEVTPRARAIGAANTLWYEDDVLWADNTDVIGWLADLDDQAPGWDVAPDTALVLGAGGAARAILYGLRERDFRKILITNRSPERAVLLADWLGDVAHVLPWEERHAAVSQAGLIVNTTALGMAHQPPLELEMAGLSRDAVVSDIVYIPLETQLLRDAQARGARIVNGLGMLLHQAAPGFEKWFGCKPAVTPALRRLVENDISR